jgi:hypothetical protein
MPTQVALLIAGQAAQQTLGLLGTTIHRLHDHKLSKLKVGIVEMMAGKVTAFQLVTIRDLGQFVLNMAVEEHKMLRQEYALDKAAHRATTDVVLRAELNASIDKALTQMTRIREHATAFHDAIAVLLGRAAGQLMHFTGDISLLRMPGELTAPEPLPVIDAVPIPANTNDADDAEMGR